MSSLTHKWLRQNLQPYATPDLVFAHVDALLSRQNTIRPKTDVYTYDDGRTQLLLCLHGLLPIAFRGTAYHIPIALWIPRDYPRPDMDVSGRCRVHYLRDWERKSEGCSLTALLEAMQQSFSREPPVYAKPRDAAATTTTTPPTHSSRPSATPTPDYTHRPPPPLPGDRADSVQTHAQAPISDGQPGGPPPLPAKPGLPAALASSRSPSAPLPNASPALRTQSPAPLTSPALALRPPPPLPPQEVAVAAPAHLQNSPVPPTYASHGHARAHASVDPPPNPNAWPAGGPSGAYRSHMPYRAAGHGQSPSPPPPPPLPPAMSLSGVLSPAAAYGGFSPHGPPQAGRLQSPAPPPPFANHPAGGAGAAASPPYAASPPPPFTPAFSHSHAAQAPAPPPPSVSVPAPDLLDAEDDGGGPSTSTAPLPAGAPPRPPNPELLRLHARVHAKLSAELASLAQATAHDAARLRATQADLLAGPAAVRDEMARLEAVRDVCTGVAARMAGVVEAGERTVAELRRKGDPAVDEMICSTTIVHNQLINLVAEDNAIEDTIYHLHRALNTGRVDLERFLRVTRVLAEEQFMKRALVEKIQAGLPMGNAGYSGSADWR